MNKTEEIFLLIQKLIEKAYDDGLEEGKNSFTKAPLWENGKEYCKDVLDYIKPKK